MAKTKINKKPKKISNYWQNRLLEEQDHLWTTISTETESELAKQYLRLEKKVENELNRLWLEIIKDKGTPQFNVADLYNHQRYYDLLNYIREQLNENGIKQYEVMEKKFTDMYKENYKIVGKYYGKMRTTLDEKKMQAIIDAYWKDNKNFSDRIWTNQAQLNESLKNSIIDAAVVGDSYMDVAQNIMKNFGVSYNSAVRLVRTELARVQNQSTIEKYKDIGIDKLSVICVWDDRTCQICLDHEGKEVRVDEVVIGENVGPFHPNCRCTTIAVMNDMEHEEASNYEDNN